MLVVNCFVLLDAVIIKSRYLIICVGILFVALNVYNVYANTLGDSNNGIVLVKYNIQGKSYTIMKRSTQRSIYLQVLLFSANGIYTTVCGQDNEADDVCNGQYIQEHGQRI